MTREDAIYWIKNLAVLSSEKDIANITEALDMAIEALQQQRKAILPKHCIVPSGDYVATAGVSKRGKWIDRASELDADFRRHDFVCSECAHTANYFVGGSEDWWDMEKPKYCPNCGTRMERDRK